MLIDGALAFLFAYTYLTLKNRTMNIPVVIIGLWKSISPTIYIPGEVIKQCTIY